MAFQPSMFLFGSRNEPSHWPVLASSATRTGPAHEREPNSLSGQRSLAEEQLAAALLAMHRQQLEQQARNSVRAESESSSDVSTSCCPRESEPDESEVARMEIEEQTSELNGRVVCDRHVDDEDDEDEDEDEDDDEDEIEDENENVSLNLNISNSNKESQIEDDDDRGDDEDDEEDDEDDEVEQQQQQQQQQQVDRVNEHEIENSSTQFEAQLGEQEVALNLSLNDNQNEFKTKIALSSEDRPSLAHQLAQRAATLIYRNNPLDAFNLNQLNYLKQIQDQEQSKSLNGEGVNKFNNNNIIIKDTYKSLIQNKQQQQQTQIGELNLKTSNSSLPFGGASYAHLTRNNMTNRLNSLGQFVSSSHNNNNNNNTSTNTNTNTNNNNNNKHHSLSQALSERANNNLSLNNFNHSTNNKNHNQNINIISQEQLNTISNKHQSHSSSLSSSSTSTSTSTSSISSSSSGSSINDSYSMINNNNSDSPDNCLRNAHSPHSAASLITNYSRQTTNLGSRANDFRPLFLRHQSQSHHNHHHHHHHHQHQHNHHQAHSNNNNINISSISNNYNNNHHHHHHHNHHSDVFGPTHKADSDDLDRIRNFIEQFKARRGALGLTQKQAAQCFRAYTNDRFAFSDNFVGHFEGFQFRPQTAMTIADSLAEWLEFAENETRNGRMLNFMPGKVKETRKRKYEVIRIRDSAKRILVEAFEKNKSPSTSELETLSKKTNIPSRNIEIFFKNRRTSRQYHQ